MSNAKGDRGERELANKFDDEGWGVMRAPASGSATDRELPDILAGDGQVFYAVEVKRATDGKVYIDGEKLNGLKWFAAKFRADAYLAVRYDYGQWWFLLPSELYVTSGGNFRVTPSRAKETGRAWGDII